MYKRKENLGVVWQVLVWGFLGLGFLGVCFFFSPLVMALQADLEVSPDGTLPPSHWIFSQGVCRAAGVPLFPQTFENGDDEGA